MDFSWLQRFRGGAYSASFSYDSTHVANISSLRNDVFLLTHQLPALLHLHPRLVVPSPNTLSRLMRGTFTNSHRLDIEPNYTLNRAHTMIRAHMIDFMPRMHTAKILKRAGRARPLLQELHRRLYPAGVAFEVKSAMFNHTLLTLW